MIRLNPFFLHILPLTEIYFRDCGNFEFQTHICTVEKKSSPERKQKRLINTAGEIQRMENSMFAQLPIKLLKSNELMKNKRIRNQSIDQKSVMLKLR